MTAYADLLLESAFNAFAAGRRDEAEKVLRLAVGLGDKNAHILYFLGHMYHLSGRYDDAAWFLTAALAIDPGHARAHNDLGETLRSQDHVEAAVPHLEQAIALEPSLAHPYGNLAAALVALDRPKEALRWARESLHRSTDKAVAHCDMGSVFGRLNRSKEAVRQYDLALELDPENARAHYFRGLMRLALGQMPDAWPDHEARLVFQGLRYPGETHWTGQQDLTGRTILLYDEQGFGDTLQFIRYAPLVAARGATVLIEVQRGLGTLCAASFGRVFDAGDILPPFDLHCPLMSLPAALGTTLDTIPAIVPYLASDPAYKAEWSSALGPWRKVRVGLAWSGNTLHAADRGRSVALALLEPLLNRTDIECHAIQRDIRETDRVLLADFPNLTDHSTRLTDFNQTAALVGCMDLVISVDTAVLHLAGAMNVPALAMLAHNADWRWMRDCDDSPWYPSLRLFRQKQHGDWSSVIEQIGANLDQWAIDRR
jgi:Flp pilus assembly protein TadD